MHVLIFEDDLALRAQLTTLLSCEGHDVAGTADFEDAKDLISRGDIDLLIADLHIIGSETGRVVRGGIQLIRWLRSCKKAGEPFGHIPVLAISGANLRAGNPYALPAAKLLGANELLEKPFSNEQIAFAVSRLADAQTAATVS
ncbi:MAG: response regulator [Pseudomonadota bacterium]